jgi:hypothetical protein
MELGRKLINGLNREEDDSKAFEGAEERGHGSRMTLEASGGRDFANIQGSAKFFGSSFAASVFAHEPHEPIDVVCVPMKMARA